MTRINVVPVTWLTDEHLIAEYRELPRAVTGARPVTPQERPPAYKLGRGHVLFFYPLGRFLRRRHAALVDEMLCRDFLPLHRDPLPLRFREDYTPTREAVHLNLQRLNERTMTQPRVPRYRSAPTDRTHYVDRMRQVDRFFGDRHAEAR